MQVSQSIAPKSQKSVAKKATFSSVIHSEAYQKMLMAVLSDSARVARFVASITSAVAVNDALKECEHNSIISSALLGESLQLSPSPQLGQFYLVPYRDNKTGKVNATFQLGYKGLLQLAIRSGYYKKIVVLPIKEGELVKFDPLEEEIVVNLIENDDEREAKNTIGYYAMFEYISGFRKAIYWSKEKMLCHADKYSKAFSRDAYVKVLNGEIPKSEMWKYSSFYYSDFDGMACKNMLRQLISKWGIMSVDMQKGMVYDQSTPIMDGDTIVDAIYPDANDGSMEENVVEANVVEAEEPKEEVVPTVQTPKRGRPPKSETVTVAYSNEGINANTKYNNPNATVTPTVKETEQQILEFDGDF